MIAANDKDQGAWVAKRDILMMQDKPDDALAALQVMASPFWRRPNENGTWGIVRGIRWARLDRTDLLALEANPGWRLPAEA